LSSLTVALFLSETEVLSYCVIIIFCVKMLPRSSFGVTVYAPPLSETEYAEPAEGTLIEAFSAKAENESITVIIASSAAVALFMLPYLPKPPRVFGGFKILLQQL
jgi:hypothetical protein